MKSLIPRVSFDGVVRQQKSNKKPRELMPVISAFECAFERDMAEFVQISTVPRSKVTPKLHDVETHKSFSPFRSIFGEGVLLSTVGNRMNVDILESVSELSRKMATLLLNNTEPVGLQFTIHGRDTHYYVHPEVGKVDSDLQTLGFRESNRLSNGVNVTVHRYQDSVDLRLHGNRTVINIRYGSNIEEERYRILHHAKQRAVDHAWILEQEFLERQEHTVNRWTSSEIQALQQRGLVPGFEGKYIKDVDNYPELADNPKNIKFVPRT